LGNNLTEGNNLTVRVNSPEDTDRLAWVVSSLVAPGDVLGLIGPLGAGKTRFTAALFKALGVVDYVRSPSFTLVNEYDGRVPMVHMDLYRLPNPEDIEDLGYEEYFFGDSVVVVEWADKALSYLPEDHIRISFARVDGDDSARLVTFWDTGTKSSRVAQEVRSLWHSLP